MPPDKQASSFERDMAGLHLARSVSEQREPDEAPAAPPQLEHWEVLSGGQCLPQCEDTVYYDTCCLAAYLPATPAKEYLVSV